MSVKGTVVRVSNIKPLCTHLAFECGSCAFVQVGEILHNFNIHVLMLNLKSSNAENLCDLAYKLHNHVVYTLFNYPLIVDIR